MNEKTQKLLDEMKYDEKAIDEGIKSALSEEKNASPRYNPYYLRKETPELTELIEQDLEKQEFLKNMGELNGNGRNQSR